MTWICDFGVVNCPICQRAREDIKSMLPNIPDKVIDKTIKEQKINLHQKIETVSISIMNDGKPKIEVKGDKDRKLKDNPDNPFFSRQLLTKTETNTEPWKLDDELLSSIIGLDDITTLQSRLTGIPFTTSVKEGDLPPLGIDFGTSPVFSFKADGPISPLGIDWPSAYPMEYRMIGGGTKKIQEPQRVDKLVPTSKLYKDMKDKDELEFYRKAGIKSYKARDGKNTIIVDRKSEITF